MSGSKQPWLDWLEGIALWILLAALFAFAGWMVYPWFAG
jgi:hypothetical protein